MQEFYETMAKEFASKYGITTLELKEYLFNRERITPVPEGRFTREILDEEWNQIVNLSGDFRDAYENALGVAISKVPAIRFNLQTIPNREQAYSMLNGVVKEATQSALSRAFRGAAFFPRKVSNRSLRAFSIPMGGQPKK